MTLSCDRLFATMAAAYAATVGSHLALAQQERSARVSPPVAIRYWGEGAISIESYWLPPVVVGPADVVASPTLRDRVGEFGLTVPTTPLSDVASDEADHDRPNSRRLALDLFDPSGAPRKIQQRYDRLPNQPRATLQSALNRMATSGHEMVIRSAAGIPRTEGGIPAQAFPLLITVDGVRIVHWGKLGPQSYAGDFPSSAKHCDVLLLPLLQRTEAIELGQWAGVIEQLRPRFAIPLAGQASNETADANRQGPATPTDGAEILRSRGNTLAVGSAKDASNAASTIVLLRDRPWQPAGELGDLLDRMDAACRSSQQVFAPLSIEQMNFRPGDGSHTPRWNAEHMMGRQLLFFTQIYSAVDPAFSPVDWNPEQMPADYEPAHATWTGAEEARQMQRANALVRRFAYLLDGVPLDAPAPGSGWTLRRLLEQMERHFGEHTANVQKKFKLPDWPSK